MSDVPAVPVSPASVPETQTNTPEPATPPVVEEKSEPPAPAAVAEKPSVPTPPVHPSAARTEWKRFLLSLNRMGMGKQRMMLIQSVALMLNAGLPLIDTLRTQLMEAKGKVMRTLVQDMMTAVENGVPFWRAMDDQCLFSPYEIALVRIGEEGGNLARNMEYLAEQQEKDRALKAKVKMAMIYPTIVLTLVFVLIMVLGLFVLPNLVQVLFSLNVPLPFTTRMVIAFSNAFEKHGAVFVPLLLMGLISFFIGAKYTRFRVVSQWIVFHIPGVGSLAREASIAQCGVIMGGLLRAGVPLVEALKSLVEVTHIISFKKFYAALLEHVNNGDSFSKSFQAIPGSTHILPISVQQLVVTGERSGALSEVLLKVADMYDKKASESAERLPTILEPVLLLFIGGIVATIAFAIIVPIYSVVGNIGR